MDTTRICVKNGLNIWVGLVGVSIMVVDDIGIDLVLSSIDKYIQHGYHNQLFGIIKMQTVILFSCC